MLSRFGFIQWLFGDVVLVLKKGCKQYYDLVYPLIVAIYRCVYLSKIILKFLAMSALVMSEVIFKQVNTLLSVQYLYST
jgi:hypothetical protein